MFAYHWQYFCGDHDDLDLVFLNRAAPVSLLNFFRLALWHQHWQTECTLSKFLQVHFAIVICEEIV